METHVCTIIGNAPIMDFSMVRKEMKRDSFMIFCDGGLRYKDRLSVTPDLVIGDFDSWNEPLTGLDADIISLPREKDDTDTMAAIKEGLKRGFKEFTLIGVSGGRMDHSLVNIYSLLYLKEHGAHGIIADDHSKMELADSKAIIIPPCFSFFSLLAITGPLENVTIKNARFPLEKGSVFPSYQYAVSNEPLPGESAFVSVGKGTGLLISVL